jgi:hypothetical protein
MAQFVLHIRLYCGANSANELSRNCHDRSFFTTLYSNSFEKRSQHGILANSFPCRFN